MYSNTLINPLQHLLVHLPPPCSADQLDTFYLASAAPNLRCFNFEGMLLLTHDLPHAPLAALTELSAISVDAELTEEQEIDDTQGDEWVPGDVEDMWRPEDTSLPRRLPALRVLRHEWIYGE